MEVQKKSLKEDLARREKRGVQRLARRKLIGVNNASLQFFGKSYFQKLY